MSRDSSFGRRKKIGGCRLSTLAWKLCRRPFLPESICILPHARRKKSIHHCLVISKRLARKKTWAIFMGSAFRWLHSPIKLARNPHKQGRVGIKHYWSKVCECEINFGKIILLSKTIDDIKPHSTAIAHAPCREVLTVRLLSQMEFHWAFGPKKPLNCWWDLQPKVSSSSK